MNLSRLRSFGFTLTALVCLLLLGASLASAQTTLPAITIGQNISGSITDQIPQVKYSLAVATTETLNIQVLAISSQSFAPTFRVLDADGTSKLKVGNPNTQASVQGSVNLQGPNTYTVIVDSARKTKGQFLLVVQTGAPLTPPTALTPGQPVTASVEATTRQAYLFTALQTDGELLNVTSTSTSNSPAITLSSADTGETLAQIADLMTGVNLHLPMGTANYLLEITSSGGSTAESATICLSTESGSVTCPSSGSTAVAAIPTSAPTTAAAPVIDPNGPCEVMPSTGVADNVRSGPDTSFAVLVQLPVNQTAQVIGRLGDNSWFQVNDDGTLGWISATVVVVGGNCGGVAVVAPPSAPPPPEIPTNTPLPIIIPIASATPSIHLPIVPIGGTPHIILIPTATLSVHLPIVPIGVPPHIVPIVETCPGGLPQRLIVGGIASLVVSQIVIHSSPDFAAPVLVTKYSPLTVHVESGPTCVGSYTWWYVRYDNTHSGWVVESSSTTYYFASN